VFNPIEFRVLSTFSVTTRSTTAITTSLTIYQQPEPQICACNPVLGLGFVPLIEKGVCADFFHLILLLQKLKVVLQVRSVEEV
jgi:hypothetical protein